MRELLRRRPGWVLLTALGLAGGGAPSARASELRLEAVTVESSAIVVDVLASDLRDAGSFDLIVRFDPARLAPPTRESGALARHGMALDHAAEPGSYRLAVLVPNGVSGEGRLARLRFPVQEGSGSVDLELEARVTDLTGTPIDVRAASARVSLAADPDPSKQTEAPAEDEQGKAAREDHEGEAPPEEGASETDTAAPGDGPPRFDADGRPLDPERRAEDLAARAAGYRLQVQFEPATVLAEGPSAPIRIRIRAWRSIEALALAPGELRITGNGATIEGVEREGDALSVRARAERRSLPASVELAAFGLLQRHLLPVYPRATVDLDGDGTEGARDREALIERLGLRTGSEGYEASFDLVRDGVIDAIDLEAFRANLVESERARRLERIGQSADAKKQDPVAGRAEAP